MSTLPNPLANIANAPVLQLPADRRSRYGQTNDPQLETLFDQKAQVRLALNFQLDDLEKRARRAIQQLLSSQPIQKELEVRHAQDIPQESSEMRWLVENRHTLEGYRGEWLLISTDSLIVHSADFNDVQRAIADRRIHSPLVYYVPTEEESNFIAF